MYINWFAWIIFFDDRDKEKLSNFLNVMVNYHYHGESRVITIYGSGRVFCQRRKPFELLY